ncbi:MAG: TrmH family RNA methyltransferase [Patescibacteria group bacterium]
MTRRLNSKKLRTIDPEAAERLSRQIKRSDIYLVLEDVLDTYNIGGFFRLADAIGAKKIYLCGATATPPNSKIRKAAVGTDKFLPWEYKETALAAIADLRQLPGLRVVAVEQCRASIDYRRFNYDLPLAFVFGNETYGLSKIAQKASDAVVEIPMYGINKSLNVMIAAGIVAYFALGRLRPISPRGH